MKRAFHGDWMDALPSRFINEIPESSVEKNETNIVENDEFEFNQDNSIEFDEGYRSPVIGTKNKIIKWKKIENLKRILSKSELDGYLIPKNDEFFNEYVSDDKDRLKYISNFSGSFGLALILRDENYLFIDGRYTLQAKKSSGKFFKIVTIPNEMPTDIFQNQNLVIGF